MLRTWDERTARGPALDAGRVAAAQPAVMHVFRVSCMRGADAASLTADESRAAAGLGKHTYNSPRWHLHIIGCCRICRLGSFTASSAVKLVPRGTRCPRGHEGNRLVS